MEQQYGSNLNGSNLTVKRYESREPMGQAVAGDVAAEIQRQLERKPLVSVVFASAPSQLDFLRALRAKEGIPWERVVAFHLDEYIGLPAEAEQSFSAFLRKELFQYRQPRHFHQIDGLNDPADECRRYAQLLADTPLDIACIGIGENGHIAFNDPHVADFQDPAMIKPVELDEASRIQQVNDGCFPRLEDVPTRALTLTIPAILSASSIYCTVPGIRKSEAVRRTLTGEIDVACPASILRTASRCTLYLDRESASLLAE